MAFGRSQRIDGRRLTSYCSTATLVVFVALCLVGAWMITSSTVAPLELFSSGKTEVINKRMGTRSIGNTIAPKTTSETSDDQNFSESQEDRSVDPNKGEKDDDSVVTEEVLKDKYYVENSADKSQIYNDENGAGEGSEMAKTDEGSPAEGGAIGTEGQNSQQNGIDTNEGGGIGTGGQNSQQSSIDTSETTNTEQDEDNEEMDSNHRSSEHESKEMEGNKGNKLAKSLPQQSNNGKNSSETVAVEPNLEIERRFGDDSNEEQHSSDDMKNLTQAEETDEDKAAQDNKEKSLLKEMGEKNKKTGVENTEFKNKSILPDGAQLELLNETITQNGAWSTQAAESKNEKEVQESSPSARQYSWKLCNVTAGEDYIPCLDNEKAIRNLHNTKHFEHRERHCPEEAPTCLVPLPKGYQISIEWPASRDKIWYSNAPHTKLAVVKGHQNWVKVSGEHLIFPGGGTQFKNGALHYIDFMEESMPEIAWGKQSRVVLDVGCGVASFGGYLFDRDTLTMSFAPKDEHEAQVQFALERGIPAISAVMGTLRLPFPSGVFDAIHCARCRVPWYAEGGMLLLELNRLLRPGGLFVWSATPVYRKRQEDKDIWNAMSALTKSMCWERVAKFKDVLNEVGMAIYRKPSNNTCYQKRKQNTPPICQESDDPDAAWNISLQTCMHSLPVNSAVRGSHWPYDWPLRLEKAPYWLNNSQVGVYGRPAPVDFEEDYKHWKKVVANSYLNGMGIEWSTVRNVMDMRSVYGGFAAALQDMKVWVMNVVSIDSPDTLPIIYDRGLFGIYHDWCESFSSYPRTYDLLHADHLFSMTKKRCNTLPLFVEVDRLLRPEGKFLVRDTKEVITELVGLATSLKWEIRMTFVKGSEGLLVAQKTMWRPDEAAAANSS